MQPTMKEARLSAITQTNRDLSCCPATIHHTTDSAAAASHTHSDFPVTFVGLCIANVSHQCFGLSVFLEFFGCSISRLPQNPQVGVRFTVEESGYRHGLSLAYRRYIPLSKPQHQRYTRKDGHDGHDIANRTVPGPAEENLDATRTGGYWQQHLSDNRISLERNKVSIQLCPPRRIAQQPQLE